MKAKSQPRKLNVWVVVNRGEALKTKFDSRLVAYTSKAQAKAIADQYTFELRRGVLTVEG